MHSDGPKSESFWKSVPGLLTGIAAVLTALATVIGTLYGVGVIKIGKTTEPSSPPPPTSTSVYRPSYYQQAPGNSAPKGDRAAINLVYSGDPYGCLVNLTVQVGDQAASPTSDHYHMRGVATGVQTYGIQGTIECQNTGKCNASGQGTVNVVDGAVYDLAWKNREVNYCTVTLQ
ncbi:hypothetical protein [Nocardia sp. CA-119907]|uniref:hypothetical protein n=1 Tax=Nocardia sp. CA-119907 TaxID=3239973 RepID=UPI003D99A9A7